MGISVSTTRAPSRISTARLTPLDQGSVVRQSTVSLPLNCVPWVLKVAVALPAVLALAVIVATSSVLPPPGTLHRSMLAQSVCPATTEVGRLPARQSVAMLAAATSSATAQRPAPA